MTRRTFGGLDDAAHQPPPPVDPYAMNAALEAHVAQGWQVISRGDGRARLQRRWRAVTLTLAPLGRVESRRAVSNWTVAAIVAAAAVALALAYALTS